MTVRTTQHPKQHGTHRHRPPVDHRFLGLDTRAFPYALAILAVWLVWVVIVPAIDSAVTSEDPTAAGDRIAITDSLSFVPAVEWNIDSGFRVGEGGAIDDVPSVSLTRSSVNLSVTTDSFTGSADELLTQVDAVASATSGTSFLAMSGARQPVVTDGGLSGVQVSFDTPSSAGSVTTFVVDGNGVRVQIVGPPDQIANRSAELASMIGSMSATEGVTR